MTPAERRRRGEVITLEEYRRLLRKPHKYGVSPRDRRTYNGVVYDSRAEAKRAQELDLSIRIGEVLWWIGQPLFRLGLPENTFRADFLVVPATGPVRAEDVKGCETRQFRRNLRLWRAYGPCPLWVIKRNATEIVPAGDKARRRDPGGRVDGGEIEGTGRS